MPAGEDSSSASMPLAPGVTARPDGLRLQYARSSGPGGQNVNKVNTQAQLWVKIEALIGLTQRAKQRLRTLAGSKLTIEDEIHIRADSERSQEANRSAAFERLRELILEARVEPKVRRKTRPSKASKRRRLDGKRLRGEIKAGRQSRGVE